MNDEFLEFTIQADETPATMEMNAADAMAAIREDYSEELDRMLTEFDSLLARRQARQNITVSKVFNLHHDMYGPYLMRVVITLREEPSPPLEELLPPAPDFTGHLEWMAEISFQGGYAFWRASRWIYVLYADDHTWEKIRDESSSDVAGFEWMLAGERGKRLGIVSEPESHGDTGIVEEQDITWLQSHRDQRVFALRADGRWQRM